MSKAWIEDLWLTEPRETLPDGSKVKIPVPSSVTKSLAAYMKTPEKAKVVCVQLVVAGLVTMIFRV